MRTMLLLLRFESSVPFLLRVITLSASLRSCTPPASIRSDMRGTGQFKDTETSGEKGASEDQDGNLPL